MLIFAAGRAGIETKAASKLDGGGFARWIAELGENTRTSKPVLLLMMNA